MPDRTVVACDAPDALECTLLALRQASGAPGEAPA